jgi:hypothetical protein
MTRFLLPLLLLAPLALIAEAPSAQAQMWNSTYQRIGPGGYGTITGPGGYRGTYQRQQIGNFGFSNYRDNHGSTSCTTQRIGSTAFVNCY